MIVSSFHNGKGKVASRLKGELFVAQSGCCAVRGALLALNGVDLWPSDRCRSDAGKLRVMAQDTRKS
eukprot:scaffold161980_cov40-Prasinocladus_malaysianus.AAC.2